MSDSRVAARPTARARVSRSSSRDSACLPQAAAGLLHLQGMVGNQVVLRSLVQRAEPGESEPPEVRKARLARFRAAMALFGGPVPASEPTPAIPASTNWAKVEPRKTFPAPAGGYETTELKDDYLKRGGVLDTTEAWQQFEVQYADGKKPRGVTAEGVIGKADRTGLTRVPGLSDEELEAFRLTYRRYFLGAHRQQSAGSDPTSNVSNVFYWGAKNQAFTTKEMRSLKGDNVDRAIFVMTRDGGVYVADQAVAADEVLGEFSDWQFYHSSFLSGRPVAAAGEIEIRDGKLVGISDKSGHYQPTSRFTVQLLKAFQKFGVDLEGVYLELSLDGTSHITVDADDLLRFDGDIIAYWEAKQEHHRAALERKGCVMHDELWGFIRGETFYLLDESEQREIIKSDSTVSDVMKKWPNKSDDPYFWNARSRSLN